MLLCTFCLAGPANILREAAINPAKYVPMFTNRTIDKKFTKNTANYVIIISIISVKPHTFPSLANIAINQKLTQTEMFLEGSSCCCPNNFPLICGYGRFESMGLWVRQLTGFCCYCIRGNVKLHMYIRRYRAL